MRNSPCTVCGSTRGTSLFYGGLVCCGCKVFFLRSVTGKARYRCSNEGTCREKASADAPSWLKCRACRYRSCLEANMRPAAVGVVRGQRAARAHAGNEDEAQRCSKSPGSPDDAKIPKSARIQAPTALGFSLFPYDGVDEFPISTAWDGLGSMLSRLRMLERYCDVSDSPTGPSKYVNLDVPLEVAMKNPLALCQRTPAAFTSRTEVMPSILKSFRALFARYALHYLDWVAGLAEIRWLPEKDKMGLVTSQMCVSELVVLVYHSWTARSPGIVFPGGAHYYDSNRVPTNDIDAFCQIVSRYVHQEVFPELRTLQLTHDEYILLKAVVFFTPTCRLSDAASTQIRKARSRYEQALIDCVAKGNPLLCETDRQLRVYRIISLQRHFVFLAMQDNLFLSRLCTLNIGNMQSALLYDFYLKAY
ncbi:unnamed protein product, partial [Mesorhabditis spiculigera]